MRSDSVSSDVLLAFLHRSVREVHRDESLWVLDKPAGVLSHPNPPRSSAPQALLRAPYDFDEEAFELRLPGGGRRRVFLVHRLDQDTSGLILCTFTPDAAALLKEALYHRQVMKEYRALLLAAPTPAAGTWSDALAKVPGVGKVEVRRCESAAAINARTEYRVLRQFPGSGLALVALEPQTGRTHQLRVQAAHRGVPIAGDDRYGDFSANRFLAGRIGLKHMFLHASRLELRHPRTGHLMTFRAELSRRLGDPLARLETLHAAVPRRSGRGDDPGPRRGRRLSDPRSGADRGRRGS